MVKPLWGTTRVCSVRGPRSAAPGSVQQTRGEDEGPVNEEADVDNGY